MSWGRNSLCCIQSLSQSGSLHSFTSISYLMVGFSKPFPSPQWAPRFFRLPGFCAHGMTPIKCLENSPCRAPAEVCLFPFLRKKPALLSLLSSTFVCPSPRLFLFCNCNDLFTGLFLYLKMSDLLVVQMVSLPFYFQSSTTEPGM